MNAVKKVWVDEENFLVDLRVGGVWGVLFAFPINELAGGASLQRMMNERVRGTLKHNGNIMDAGPLKEAAREGVKALRGVIEGYFEIRGIGEQIE